MQTLQTEDTQRMYNIKSLLIDIVSKNRVGHLPSSLSSLEILYTLYSKITNINKENLKSINRDRVIISKEHCKMGQICVLAELGLLDKNLVYEWLQDGGAFGHDIFCGVGSPKASAIDVSFGSLGQGIGVGIGLALANPNNNIYVIVGDGELQEGSCWEAFMFIGQHQIKNITVIIDRNNIQAAGGYTKDVIDTSSNLPEQIGSFHLDVIECDGHNIEELGKAFRQETTKPKCIVAHTIKGKECQFVLATKDFGYFHGAAFMEEELKETQEAINNEYTIK